MGSDRIAAHARHHGGRGQRLSASDAGYYEQPAIWGEDSIVAPEHQRQRFEAIDRLLPANASTVLDVGAGDGRVLHYLGANRAPAPLLVAAERSQAALAHAGRVRVQATAEALPFADRAIDAVLCCEVLEHLPPPLFDATRAELARVARSHIIVTVPNRERRHANEIRCRVCGCAYNPDRHLRSFRRSDLESLVPDFDLDAVEEVGPRAPAFPRFARIGLERLGLLWRPGRPQCPQCGTLYQASRRGPDGATPAQTPNTPSPGRRGYVLARRYAPRRRHPYWLAARWSRRR